MRPFVCNSGYALSVSLLAFSAAMTFSALALTGCGGMSSLPDTPIQTSSAQPGAIQGSVYGGHAPIVGAQVYVFQVGTGGYASASSSLITNGSAGTDSSGRKYVLTAADGSFNVTGDYSCTTGVPVYLAAIGGQTADNIGGAAYNTTPITISAGAVSSDGSTLTFTANNLLYPNQGIVFNFPPGSGWSGLNGGVYNVISTRTYPLTNTSFSIVYPSGVTVTGSAAGGTATPQSASNPAIANLAVLGNCPTTGNFSTSGTGSDVISYVYMNEVSTTAAAYSLSGFGSGPFNIGYPGGDTLALTGIENAANNAAQLYDIEGKYISSTFAGEGHIANPTTPAGNGVVPQATLDTLGNILASCVDSTNLGNSATNPDAGTSSGTPSTSCSKLFSEATSNGIPYLTTGYGTIATDIATAAFNIAHNPGSNLSSLFALQGSETTPFAPNLASQPNDFTIGIQYTAALNPGAGGLPALVEGAEAVAVDATGNFWFTGQPAAATGYLVEDSPLGVELHDHYNTAFSYGDVAIDSTGNAWTGNQNAYVDAVEDGPSTSYAVTNVGSNLTYAQAAIANGSGDVYFVHGPTNPPPSTSDNDQTLTELDTAGVVSAGALGNVATSFPAGAYATHGAIDNSGYLWFTSNNGNLVTRVNPSTGAPLLGFPFNQASILSGCGLLSSVALVNPEQPAIDANGNAWVPVYNGGTGAYLAKISPTGGCTSFTNFDGPFGATIDGANNLWVTNRTGNTISEVNATSGATISPTNSSTTPATYGYTVGGLLSGPEGIAVDLSGDLIITNYTGNSIVEVIGAATPTYLPLGAAAAHTKLGSTP